MKMPLVLFCAFVALMGCRKVNEAPVSTTPQVEVGAAKQTPLPQGVHRGVCLAHNYQHGGTKGYGSEASASSKKELAGLGVDWVSLTPFGWQGSLDATEISFDPKSRAGESDARMLAEAAQARKLGMKVMVKPHLWISHSLWRGHIKPAGAEEGWRAWFASYTAFILHFARLSERLSADAFVIGLELASSSSRRQDWVKVVDAVRQVYSGPIIYAANWNETELVAFWDKVDFIGIQFFAPLSDSLDPTRRELTAAIASQLDDYQALSRKFSRPVVLTEFGYKSIKATAAAPGTWPEHLPESAKTYDEENQARAYSALLNEVSTRDFIKGVYVWKWFTDVKTDEEGRIGFSPRGKKAASVLSKAYARP